MKCLPIAVRFFGGCAVLVFVSAQLSIAVEAGIPPKRMHASRDKVAETCAALGSNGRDIGLGSARGKYGCENLDSGATLICEESGECKYYFYDPRSKFFRKDPDHPNRIIITPIVRAALSPRSDRPDPDYR